MKRIATKQFSIGCASMTLAITAAFGLTLSITQQVVAAPSGEKIFASNCAACHLNGKNSIDPKKPVIGSKKLASLESFKTLLTKQNGMMPPFPKISDNAEALQALYTYAKNLK